MSDAIAKLNLKEMEFFPPGREIRPKVSVLAWQLPHKNLEGKLLVGCQYANVAAAGWVK
jgi:hypothetical protein